MEAALIKSRLSDDSDGQTSDGAHKHAFPYSNNVVSTIHQKDRLEVGGKRLEGG